MKKLFLALVVLMSMYVTANAQVSMNQTVSNPTGSISGAGADTLSYTLSHSYQNVSIQFLVTKTSGTVAGTAVLSQSVDGVNYVTLSTTTLTDISKNTAVWTNSTAARYFRVIVSGGTSLVETATAKLSASGQ